VFGALVALSELEERFIRKNMDTEEIEQMIAELMERIRRFYVEL